MPRLFCFGLGYTALALATRLLHRGWTVSGTCRSEDKRRALAERGIVAHLFDRDHPPADPTAMLAGVTHILSSIPPDPNSEPFGDVVVDNYGPLLAGMASLDWVGYLSTTGVYGNRDGGVVDENSQRLPSGERGRRRVKAEDGWLDLWNRFGLPVHVFRLSGIYGEGRSALDLVRTGKARRIDKRGQVFNRIHVQDIVSILLASIARPRPGGVYNGADDDPAPSHEVVAFACELLGLKPPPLIPLEEADLSPLARSFYDDNKRVSNQLIKEELAVILTYPSYRDGLSAQYALEGPR
jgi:nucleoside-diphosphate-sugar epimerase